MSKIEVDAIDKQSGSTLTLGGSGTAVTLACGATQTGFGRTGTVDWQTSIKTAATFSASNGEGYFVDTSSNAVTANLPAGSVGAIVAFKDYAQNFGTNKLTISADGSDKIEGQTFDLELTTDGLGVTLVFGDATKGWQAVNSNEIKNAPKFVVASGGTETTSGDFKIHTFTGPGTFLVTCAGNPAGGTQVDYMVVAGGGGGAGGGAGAGGYRESHSTPVSGPYTASPLATPTAITVTATGFPITVGAGGTGGATCDAASSVKGNNSVFSTITSAGGGGGSNWGNYQWPEAQGQGGSGGGGGQRAGPSSPGTGASLGNTPPVSPPQGNNGGQSFANCGENGAGGGGGGAGAVGVNGGNGCGGNGGCGTTTNISTASVTLAGGGGSGGRIPGSTAGSGGPGGGGAGRQGGPGSGTAGTANTGGGGGGAGYGPAYGTGGSGGSGIVIIRYKFQ